MIHVDVLDLWSLRWILKLSQPGDEIRYLVRAKGWCGALAARLLAARGRVAKSQLSCFERGGAAQYREFCKQALDFQLDYVEPLLRRNLARGSHARSEDELARLVRYATIHAWGFSSRAFELLMSARIENSGRPVTLLFQNGLCADAVRRYAAEGGDTAHGYSAPGRVAFPVRPGYYADHNRMGPGLLPALGYFVAILGEGLYSWLKACVRGLLPAFGEIDEEPFDILALAYQRDPLPGFNDLFWAEHFRQSHGRRVFAIHSQPLDRTAEEFYLRQADRLDRFSGYTSLRPTGRPLLSARRVARRYAREFGRGGLLVLRHALIGRQPLWLAALLVRVENKTSWVAALMQVSGARIAWAMLEGNDLNSLAMTIAVGRHGGLCFGTSWSMPYVPRIYDSIARNHVFFAWGERQAAVYRSARALPWNYVTTGYPTMRHYLGDRSTAVSASCRPDWLVRALAETSRTRVVTFFDNICAVDIIVNCDEMRAVFSALLDWLQTRQDVLLVLKTKRSGSPMLNGPIGTRIEALVQQKAVHIREEKADVEAGLAADAVIGISSSTLASLAAAHGRNCVLYDRHAVLSDAAFPAGLPHLMRIGSTRELSDALEAALARPFDNGDRGGYVDGYADGEGDRRMACFMAAVLESLETGMSPTAAVHDVHCRYQELRTLAVDET